DFYYWYVRDAQGNLMATYKTTGSNISSTPLLLAEHYMYGSSRLGQVSREQDMDQPRPNYQADSYTNLGTGYLITFTRGNKFFELANHLGSVNATLADRHLPVNSGGNVWYYQSVMGTAADYTPFGMQMQGRIYTGTGESYKFKFNGKERIYEINGKYHQYDYGMRIYDDRLGRFLSVDPLTSKYPFYTPYSYAGNKPIWVSDLDGLEEDWMTTRRFALQRQAELQLAYAKSNASVTIGPAPAKTFTQKWRDSHNIIDNVTYDIANSLYTLPQQLTSSARQADYIYNIGGNVHRSHGMEGEKPRIDNGVTAFSLFMPSAAAEEQGVGFFSRFLSSFEKKSLPSVEKMFSPAIVDRGVAEEYATATKYKGFANINQELGYQNAYYDLYNTSTSTIVDVTTTNSKNMNISGLYKKLDNLSTQIKEPYQNRILQIYVKEGQYTSEQISSLENKLSQYIKDYNLNSTFKVDKVK
ncbi:MAG: hypothetical protein J0I84_12715, partial [Terrimonas sp.]|nr:hypothetical protein [Terrimonas sp.]